MLPRGGAALAPATRSAPVALLDAGSAVTKRSGFIASLILAMRRITGVEGRALQPTRRSSGTWSLRKSGAGSLEAREERWWWSELQDQ